MRDNNPQPTGDGHAKKDISPEQVIAKLRQIGVLTGQGQAVAQAMREGGISKQSSLPSGEKNTVN